MKKKTSSKTIGTRKDEFRYHDVRIRSGTQIKKSKHPAYIWRAKGNSYDYYTLTHSKSVPGVELRKLKKNPNPQDNRDSYITTSSKTDLKSTFGKKRKGWKLDASDKESIIKK